MVKYYFLGYVLLNSLHHFCLFKVICTKTDQVNNNKSMGHCACSILRLPFSQIRIYWPSCIIHRASGAQNFALTFEIKSQLCPQNTSKLLPISHNYQFIKGAFVLTPECFLLKGEVPFFESGSKSGKTNVKFIKVIAANFLFAVWFSKLSGKGQHCLPGLLGS